jgi:uncharacterized protein with PQ loop repeat
MISTLVGTISLNISFVLYLVIYWPQIIHNRKPHHLSGLSGCMHYILYSSYCLDLIYGFSRDLQWQYKTVSTMGLLLLTTQHLQITRYYQSQKKWLQFTFSLFFTGFIAIVLGYFFIENQANLSKYITQTTGYLARIGFLIYTLPQILKNRTRQSANSISILFLWSSLTLSLLDMISAWCLDWGWPNKLGAPIAMSLVVIMLLQIKKYRMPRLLLSNKVPYNCPK